MSSAVIKAGDAKLLSRGMYSLDLRDISRQADEMLASARAQAQELLEQARTQTEVERQAVRRQARKEGFEEGVAEGRRAGHAEALSQAREQFAADQASLINTMASFVDEFGVRREQLYLAARRDVVVLAIVIARRIVERLPEIEGAAADSAAAACEAALEMVRGATEVVVRAHPDEWAAVENLTSDLQRKMKASGHFQIVEDASVGRGGVVVESADSTVDASVSSRVERIADELVQQWRRRLRELAIEL
ncbi:MAG: F0F1 ATP synthase subunit delta [Planctomycetota bacterium]